MEEQKSVNKKKEKIKHTQDIIEFPNRKSLKINIEDEMTIGDLKQKIKENEGMKGVVLKINKISKKLQNIDAIRQ